MVQVTLIKMRGRSVESLHQVRQGAQQGGLCVGIETRSRVMETAVNQVNLIGVDVIDLNGVTKTSCWPATAVRAGLGSRLVWRVLEQPVWKSYKPAAVCLRLSDGKWEISHLQISSGI